MEIKVSKSGDGIAFPMQSSESCFMASTNRLINLLSYADNPTDPYNGKTTRRRCEYFKGNVSKEISAGTNAKVTQRRADNEAIVDAGEEAQFRYETREKVWAKYLNKVMFSH